MPDNSLTTAVTGLREAMTSLQSLPKRVRSNATRKAVRAGNTVMREAIQKNADELKRQGTTMRSIGSKDKTYNNGEMGVGIVGPKKEFTEPKVTDAGNPAISGKTGEQIQQIPDNYDHLIEFGTERSEKKSFMRPAYDTSGPAAIKAMEDSLWASIVEGLNK
jgi:HK97 gp10 family phage protein